MSKLAGNPKSRPEVDAARCTGCGRCVSACPERLFTLEVSGFRKHAVLLAPCRCSGCQLCRSACAVGALGSADADDGSSDV